MSSSLVAFPTPCSPHRSTKSPAAAARVLTYFSNDASGHEDPGPDAHPGSGTIALLIFPHSQHRRTMLTVWICSPLRERTWQHLHPCQGRARADSRYALPCLGGHGRHTTVVPRRRSHGMRRGTRSGRYGGGPGLWWRAGTRRGTRTCSRGQEQTRWAADCCRAESIPCQFAMR